LHRDNSLFFQAGQNKIKSQEQESYRSSLKRGTERSLLVREQAAACLKHAGIQAVVAKSFARIYFRNAINLGLAVLQCPEAVEALEAGDDVEIGLAAGKIVSGSRVFDFFPPPRICPRHRRGRRPHRAHQKEGNCPIFQVENELRQGSVLSRLD